MKRFLSLSLCLALVVTAGMAFAADGNTADRDTAQLKVVRDHAGSVQTSASSSQFVRFKAVGKQDTFPLYGGTDRVIEDADDPGVTYANPRAENEGKFQDTNGVVPQRQGWVGVDNTDLPVFWQISTFNASNLNNNGAGNLAYWCGQTAAQAPNFAAGNGYGNGWNDILLYTPQTPLDAAVGQTVAIDFYFNHDTEPGYDFFVVEYDSAGTYLNLYSRDGSNKDGSGVFQAPGVQYSTVGNNAVYAGNDYSIDGQIKLRMIVQSDGAWSDEDGLWPTSGGAVQVDDVSVTWDAGSTLDTFEGATHNWAPDKSPFCGDFSDVYAKISDLDPCSENTSPVMGFIDYNQVVPNGPGVGGDVSTGGSLSSTWAYGITGGWVTNYTGGLTFGDLSLSNDIISPEILWDAPGTDDADPEVAGAYIQFAVWRHLPLLNGLFYTWGVRSKVAGGDYTNYADRNFVYYGDDRSWLTFNQVVTDLLLQNPESVQVRFGCIDYAGLFGFPGTDATPSPVFDNLRFVKYRINGPAFATREINLSNDGFPVSASIDVSGVDPLTNRDGLDVPFDMAQDVNSGDIANVAGDSVTVDVTSVIPGAALTDTRMLWVLDKNPLFEDAIRTAPAGRLGSWGGLKDENVVTTDPLRWTGEVVGDTTKTSADAVVEGRFFYDLPDLDFMYPGDVLRIAFQATDSDGRTTTLPGNLDAFATGTDPVDGGAYSRLYTVRALPTISDIAGTQPNILVWNDFGRRGTENDFLNAMSQLGMVEGVDFDTYTTNGPSSGVSNGLGSSGPESHGATADQLAGYDTILYFAGDLSSYLMSDGDAANNGGDKGNDLAVLTAWKNAAGADRHMAYFGDAIASATLGDFPVAGGAYLANVMGVTLTDNDVADEIGNQTAAIVAPTGLAPQFTTNFVAFGGCVGVNTFDSIAPATGAYTGHTFMDESGLTPYAPSASVIYDRLDGGARKVDITFPFGYTFVFPTYNKAPVGTSTGTELMREILTYFDSGFTGNPGQITDAPAVKRAELSVAPNPFNPMTTVKFAVPAKGIASVKVYNLRGELVKTLHQGELDAGSHDFEWNGVDNRGASVASGVYIIKAQAGSSVLTQKAMMVK